MVVTPMGSLESRATGIIRQSGTGSVVALESLIGAGSAPGSTVPSVGIALTGDHRAALRAHDIAVISRTVNNTTYLDLRSVAPQDDAIVVAALATLC